MKTICIIAAFFMAWASAQSQSYFEDTVWTKKTDQASGFWKVKFSTTDTFIVGHGMEMDLFYEAKTGEEIIRIPGIDEVFFFNNDLNFLRINNTKKIFEIFDTEIFQVMDSLESDGIEMVNSPFADVSDNQQLFVSQIANGFRVWNLNTKNIAKTKIFPNEPNLLQLSFSQVQFICNDSKIMGKIGKVYEDPEHLGNPDYYKNLSYFIVFDSNTLDSVDYFPYARSYRMTKSCQQIAVATADKYEGVEIYDFNTKQLMHKLPVNGPSLTGIEFSPDDKYVVTSNGPGQNSLIVWDVMTGNETHRYWPSSYSCLDISNSGLYILAVFGRTLRYFHARFGDTSTPEEKQISSLIYPNPATGEVNINNDMLSGAKHPEIKVYNVLGGKLMDSRLRGNDIVGSGNDIFVSAEGNVKINVSQLSPGVYFVKIGSYFAKFVKM